MNAFAMNAKTISDCGPVRNRQLEILQDAANAIAERVRQGRMSFFDELILFGQLPSGRSLSIDMAPMRYRPC